MSRIYKLDRDFVHWQNLSLVCLQRNHVTLSGPKKLAKTYNKRVQGTVYMEVGDPR